MRIRKKITVEDIMCNVLCILIYSSYWKVLLPQFSIVIGLVQFCAIVFGVIGMRSFYGGLYFCPKRLRAMFWMLLSFCGILGSALWSENIMGVKTRIYMLSKTILISFLIYLVGRSIRSKHTMERFWRTVLGINITSVVLFLALNFSNILNGLRLGLRVGDTAGSSIWLARLCVDIIIILYMLQLKQSTKIILIFLIGILTLLTFSKGPLVALIIILGICIFYRIKRSKRIVTIVFFLLLSIGIASYINSTDNYLIKERFSFDKIMSVSPGYRMDRYKHALTEIKDDFILGKGMGDWPIHYWTQDKRKGVQSIDWNSFPVYNDYPHNIFIEILYESGIIALFFYMMSIVKIGKRCVKSNEKVVYALFFLNIIYAMFSGGIVDGNVNIYYYLALICAIGTMKENQGKTIYET